jgi:hypothetical protein
VRAHASANWPFDDFEGKHVEPPPGQLVFYGDSDIEYWNLDEFFPGLSTLNCGVAGSTMEHAKKFGERFLEKYKPQARFFISPRMQPDIIISNGNISLTDYSTGRRRE